MIKVDPLASQITPGHHGAQNSQGHGTEDEVRDKAKVKVMVVSVHRCLLIYCTDYS